MKPSLLMILLFVLSYSCRKKDQPPLIQLSKQQEIEMKFEPFSHASNVMPGHTRIDSVKKMLGEADNKQYFPNQKGDTIKTVLDFICGISVVVEGKDSDTSKVDAVIMKIPYKGKSNTGLELGLSQENASLILKSNYDKKYEGTNTAIYRLNDHSSCFQVFYEKKKLVTMKMYRQ